MAAISQVSANDIDNATLTTDEIQEEISTDEIQEEISTDEIQEEISAEDIETDDVLSDWGSDIDYQSFDSIQQKINNAKSGDTIVLSGYYKGTGSEIVVNKALTIQGPSESVFAYLTADDLSRIFTVTASGVVLKNLIMRDGYADSDDGGAVYSDPSLTRHCKLINCAVGYSEAYYGGATYYCDAENVGFIYNTAERGGAMYGGNAYYCWFENNTAYDRGGGMYVRDGVTVDNCEFDNNDADFGGAFYSCAGYNTVSNTILKYNYASTDGGAIYNNEEYNSGLTVTNCDFEYNTAKDDGGAIYNGNNYNAELKVSNCDFISNKANDDGGAIYTDSSSSTEVRKSYFKSNNAGYWGGAMCRGKAYDSQFVSNIATNDGGGMYYGDEFDCSFSSNSPQNVYGTNCYESINGKITVSQSGSYYGSKTVSAKVVNTKSNSALSGVPVTFKFSNGKSATVYTGSNGIATYNVPFNPGTYRVTVSIPSGYSASPVTLSNIKITKAPATLKLNKVTSKYGAGKYFKVKVSNSKNKKGIGGVKLLLKVYTGKKYKKVHVTTDSSGWAYYGTCKLNAGKHKVKVSVESSTVSAKSKSSKITVKKATSKIWAPEGIYKYKRDGKFYIGVYNKKTGEWAKGIKLTVKVYTKGKAKTYHLKTKKNGFAELKTKKLKVGKHKVKIFAKANKNFKKSKLTSKIEITKKIITSIGYSYIYTHYSWGYAYGRSIYVTLKDMDGNYLTKKVTVSHDGAKTTGYSNSLISIPGGLYGKVVLKFKGDKKYRGSKYTINFI